MQDEGISLIRAVARIAATSLGVGVTANDDVGGSAKDGNDGGRDWSGGGEGVVEGDPRGRTNMFLAMSVNARWLS